MSPEHCVAHSLYRDPAGVIQDMIVRDKPPIRYLDTDPNFPFEARLERLDYRHIYLGKNEQPAQVAFFAQLHPREYLISPIAWMRFAQERFPRVEAWNPHILAAYLGERRYYVRPFVPGETIHTVPKRECIHMNNGKRVKRDGVIGRRIDLNRTFQIPESVQSWKDVFAAISYLEAQLLLRMMRDNPGIRCLISIHEDMENGYNAIIKPGEKQLARDGVYFYDMCADARNDADKPLVETLKQELTEELIRAGFPLFHGIDDPRDPALGYRADHGYIYQPVIDGNGRHRLDGTFELAMVELGRLGLTNVERAISFEIPGRYSIARKKEVIDIIATTFILPFLAAKGIRTR